MATFRFACKALFLFQTSLVLSAAVIHDGGAPNGVDAFRLSDFVAAQQFTLASAASLQGLMFFGSAFVNNVPSQFDRIIGFRNLFWTTRVLLGRARPWAATRLCNGSTTVLKTPARTDTVFS